MTKRRSRGRRQWMMMVTPVQTDCAGQGGRPWRVCNQYRDETRRSYYNYMPAQRLSDILMSSCTHAQTADPDDYNKIVFSCPSPLLVQSINLLQFDVLVEPTCI